MQKAYEKRMRPGFAYLTNKLVLDSASCATETKILDNEGDFKDCRTVFEEAYKRVPAMMKYHIFQMRKVEPGIVHYQEHPSAPVVSVNVRMKYYDIVIWNKAESAPPRGVSPKKVTDLFKHIYPYVPEAYRNDPFHAPPTPEEMAAAAAIMKTRQKKRQPRPQPPSKKSKQQTEVT
ncbi:TPA: hypothetical protein N0F65_005482 [Lagenidium giganteum]|uniref:Uncharacterized protein n=1 Tax=Lagenidium giganteum TaxID=4803 RepID=A0AAV2Z3I0_9STRA|nr:TPA: hypothetical protein N0F65_005482 [Lagenidium giganteum]